MGTERGRRVARVGFALSLVVLSMVYGDLARRMGWFPSGLLDRALRQAAAVLPLGPPAYVHDRVYDRAGARTLSPDETPPGLTLVTSAWTEDGELTPGVRLIDRAGRVQHTWSVEPANLFPESPTERRSVRDLNIHGAYLFPNGDVLVNVEYAGTLRLDACGEVRWRLTEGNHHSIARDEDGSFWIPAVTAEPRRASPGHPDGLPGFRRPVYQDMILRVSAEGTVLDTIHVLDALYGAGLEWHLAEEDVLGHEDPTHLNDAEPLPAEMAEAYPLFEAGDLVVSLRNVDLILVLDRVTGRVKWHASGPFIRQHDPDFLGDGWIGVFDNRRDGTRRGTMLGGSRVVALHPQSDSVRILYPTPRSDPFYTHLRGKWQALETGNLLLAESVPGRVVEVSPDGRTVWEWIVAPFGDSKVPPVADAVRVDLTRDDVAAWPCAPGRVDTGPPRPTP